MFTIQQTTEFKEWLSRLRDRIAKARILARIRNVELGGNLGDWKTVGGGVSEMRVNVGAGYRIYFARRGGDIVVLLAGGDKSTQKADIKRAIELAKTWSEENENE
ncbi:MAG: type II toxin-antitoxin system RelE/ParE family toxin [Azoarcus sp.]|nr:type II toxin-antitoxin system RelE/ParE family toxin [Azoarcus sp.]